MRSLRAIAVAVVALALFVWGCRWFAEPIVPLPAGAAADQAAGDPGPDAVDRSAPPGAAAPAPSELREEVTAPQPPGPALRVCARHARDGAPAVGMHLRVMQDNDPAAFVLARGCTDRAGIAAFASLPAGGYWLRNDRGDRAQQVEVRSGETTECRFVVQPGVRFRGVVVDSSGSPVAGAKVEMWLNHEPEERHDVAVADATGAFVVLDAHLASSLVARAPGLQASMPLRMPDALAGKPNQLVLGGGGAVVAGFVVDASGAPVADAVVRVGAEQVGRPGPAIVRTNRLGRFEAVGLWPGTHPLSAQAPGFAAHRGAIDASATTPLQRIVLRPGVSVRGTVLDPLGQPMPGVSVWVVEMPGGPRATTDAAGRFELANVPIGGLTVEATCLGISVARASVMADAAGTTNVELRMPEAADPWVQFRR